MNDNEKEVLFMEVDALFNFIKGFIEHGQHFLGFASNLLLENTDTGGLGKEAISDLLTLSKKISSKSDLLQNKIKEMSVWACGLESHH